jgi:hypothetical protein
VEEVGDAALGSRRIVLLSPGPRVLVCVGPVLLACLGYLGWGARLDEHADDASGSTLGVASVFFSLGLLLSFAWLLLRGLELLRANYGSSEPVRTTPPQFLCPITGEVMVDPVTTCDGHAFEREAIERWLLVHDTSPMTGAKLEHKAVAPAIALRQLIELAAPSENVKQNGLGHEVDVPSSSSRSRSVEGNVGLGMHRARATST